jgi:undecaprenyl-diphosphatase
MSAATGIAGSTGGGERPRQFRSNVRGTFATLFRAPRPAGRHPAWPSGRILLFSVVLAAVAIPVAMFWFDAFALAQVRSLPRWLVALFGRITDAGLSGWFLWPTGLGLIALAMVDRPPLQRVSRLVLAALAVRLGFVFAAIAVPGLFLTVIKRLIGRLRPNASGGDIWAYAPLTWQSAYHSMPSGHAATAASVAIAIGVVWPKLRPLMWTYALLIWFSRVIVSAHYPSDVVAGAIIGIAGALVVRNWFAERRLGFVVETGSSIRAFSPPPWRRLKGVARRLVSA